MFDSVELWVLCLYVREDLCCLFVITVSNDTGRSTPYSSRILCILRSNGVPAVHRRINIAHLLGSWYQVLSIGVLATSDGAFYKPISAATLLMSGRYYSQLEQSMFVNSPMRMVYWSRYY